MTRDGEQSGPAAAVPAERLDFGQLAREKGREVPGRSKSSDAAVVYILCSSWNVLKWMALGLGKVLLVLQMLVKQFEQSGVDWTYRRN